MQIGNADPPRDVTPKAGTCHPPGLCPALWLCTLTKASRRSAAWAMFKGLETNSPRTGIVCLIKQSRRAWCCTWEESGSVPRCTAEPSLGLTPDTLMTKDNLMGRNTLDHSQAHDGHSLGIMSALYNVYGARSVGESEHAALLDWETASVGRALRPNFVRSWLRPPLPHWRLKTNRSKGRMERSGPSPPCREDKAGSSQSFGAPAVV